MRKCVKKVAICYFNSARTIVKRNHVKVVTKEVELYHLESEEEARKYANRPLFKVI